MRKAHAPDAHLITGAPPNPKDEYEYRRKRYLITMTIRIVCLILAAVTYKILWLFPIFVVGAVALPWIAVVLANDRLPPQGSRFMHYTRPKARELTAASSRRDNDEDRPVVVERGDDE